MKKCFALLALLVVQAAHVFAQDTDGPSKQSEITKPSRDFVMLQFTYNNWAQKPDSIKNGGFGRGFNGYVCYDFPLGGKKKTNFSFAAGIGISTANIYFDNQQINFTDTGTKGQQVSFSPESKSYSKYKITTAYLTAPFELRYFGNKTNRNKGFKAAIGLTVGTLVGAHTKGVYKVEGSKVADKVNTKRYIAPWSFAGTARIGWGNFSVFGSYNFTQMFKEDQGPAVTPYSVGLCITGL